MKKILIIEDDQILGNIYRNKLTVEGYQVESATTGESGLALMRTFQPSMILLDLLLPQLSGVDVIKHIRSESDFAKVPVVVLSNTYLTNLIQDAWKAGATKCLSKATCSPKDILEVVRSTVGPNEGVPGGPPVGAAPAAGKSPAIAGDTKSDAEFQDDLRKSFIESLPATLTTLRSGLQALSRTPDEVTRLKQIYEMHRRIHALAGNAGIASLFLIAQMSAALEALLKELYEKPKSINASTLRTVAAAVDFLGYLFQNGTAIDQQQIPSANILVVDDEAISRRAIVYALEKAQLPSTGVDNPAEGLKLVSENLFDLIFLDVDMPEMNGFELCAKIRKMPQYKKTPVLFVTALSDFESRTSSTMAGGNDFIAKPFLFIELTVKALMHVLRGKLTAKPS
ncbi:MAG TPA: response regulator [Candidatus Acidoferrales bacterium]|jgi:DNA-binding response OmpR family regulator|nr:response regulator [Candidatus Acidoferrales bacterium]